jgi:hypothetical protein
MSSCEWSAVQDAPVEELVPGIPESGTGLASCGQGRQRCGELDNARVAA